MDKDSWPGEEKGRGTTTRLTTIDIPSPSFSVHSLPYDFSTDRQVEVEVMS